ncbi:hypothetical protein CF326_g4304 [Tilletia indica]|nr:hypothetical protein CF326_g4304 [Tilletia indica]
MAHSLEYIDEIFAHLRSQEATTILVPKPSTSTWDERAPGLHHIVHVHHRMEMAFETLWLAVDIYHAYLNLRSHCPAAFMVSALSSLWIAAKYEELEQPELPEILDYSHGPKPTVKQVLQEERMILTTLDYRISHFCPASTWLNAFSTATGTQSRTRRLSRILLDSTLMDRWFTSLKPRKRAAIALFFALKMVGAAWTTSHTAHAGLSDGELEHGAVQLWDLLRSDEYESSPLFWRQDTAHLTETAGFLRDWSFNNMILDVVVQSTAW